MNTKTFVALIALVAIGVGAYFYSSSKQSVNASAQIGAAIIPQLETNLNNVSELKIIGANSQVLTTIKLVNDVWAVEQRGAYPADISKVRAALLSLAQAKIVEEKTSNKELYAKLGVEDISRADAQGVKAVIKYNDQEAQLIVGKPGPQMNKSRYVRVVDASTSWQVDQKIDLKHQPEYWLNKDILSIEPNEVAGVSITLLEDNAVLEIAHIESEDNVSFIVKNLTDPESQVIEAELHQVTNALSSFQLLDVSSSDKFTDQTASMSVRYLLKSGAVIDLIAYDIDDVHYASINASLSSGLSEQEIAEAQKYIDQVNQITSGWVFKIPNVSYDSMYKREADVLAITEDQLN